MKAIGANLPTVILFVTMVACGICAGQDRGAVTAPRVLGPCQYVPTAAAGSSIRVTGVTPLLTEENAGRVAPFAASANLPNSTHDLSANDAGVRVQFGQLTKPYKPTDERCSPFVAPAALAARPHHSGRVVPRELFSAPPIFADSSAAPESRETAVPLQPDALPEDLPSFKLPPIRVPRYTSSTQPQDPANFVEETRLSSPFPLDQAAAAGASVNDHHPAGTLDATFAAPGAFGRPAEWTSSSVVERSANTESTPAAELPISAEVANSRASQALAASWNYSPFSPDPNYGGMAYNAQAQLGIYEDKWCVPTQRPWIELWRPMYAAGELPPGLPYLGERNLVLPHFLLYGDFRSGFAFNDNGPAEDEKYIWANRLNLEFDLKLTATERLHAFWGPIDEDGRFTRAQENNGQIEFFEEFDDDFDTLYFEGDAGYIWGGMTDQYAPFDLPFVAGKYPLLFQNGVWMFDVLEGFALTVPAQNSPLFDWSNWDLTFFFGLDDVDSPAFGNDDNLANIYGFNWFLEAYDGYSEIGYAFLEDTTGQGLSYSSIGLSYTRRYWNRVSNSLRAVISTGQSPDSGNDTADGTLLLVENALISRDPLHFVPYMNLFAGFGRPQSAARAAGTGILLNTGINFESDALTGFPTLDATANDTYGGAVGLNWLGPAFSWQLVTEFAMVQTFGNDPNRNAQHDQYAFGMRFQLPLTNAWLVRFDSMYGILEDEPDVRGARMELRWKF